MRTKSSSKLSAAIMLAWCLGGCGHALGLSGVSQIALSPDGRHLYAVSSIANSITGFARDVNTGALVQLKGAAGCVRPGGLGGCASGIFVQSRRPRSGSAMYERTATAARSIIVWLL